MMAARMIEEQPQNIGNREAAPGVAGSERLTASASTGTGDATGRP